MNEIKLQNKKKARDRAETRKVLKFRLLLSTRGTFAVLLVHHFTHAALLSDEVAVCLLLLSFPDSLFSVVGHFCARFLFSIVPEMDICKGHTL